MQDRSRVGLSISVGLVASAGVFVLSSSAPLAVSAGVGYAGGIYFLSDALGTTPTRLDKTSFFTSRKFLVIMVLMAIMITQTFDGITSSLPTTDRIALYTVLIGTWLFFAGYGAVFRAENPPDNRGEPGSKQAFDDTTAD